MTHQPHQYYHGLPTKGIQSCIHACCHPPCTQIPSLEQEHIQCSCELLTHEYINLVIKPLKKTVEIRMMMPDPVSWCRYCFTPLFRVIVDTPETLMYAGIGGKTSPVTMAIYK